MQTRKKNTKQKAKARFLSAFCAADVSGVAPFFRCFLVQNKVKLWQVNQIELAAF